MSKIKQYLHTEKLTCEQEEWLESWMHKYAKWVSTERIEKRGINIIWRLMQRVIGQEPDSPMCSDDEGFLIEEVLNDYLYGKDKELVFIVTGHFMGRFTVNRLAVKLLGEAKTEAMQPCTGKPNMRKPSKRTMQYRVKERLQRAAYELHELLLKAFIMRGYGIENAENIKIGY